jgi:cytochrome b pre-mRNA-processing protein 3
MRAMWEAFHGRAKVYASAIEAADRAALETALARNVWRGASPVGGAASLTRVVLAQTVHLAEQPLAALVSGSAHFLSATEADR